MRRGVHLLDVPGPNNEAVLFAVTSGGVLLELPAVAANAAAALELNERLWERLRREDPVPTRPRHLLPVRTLPRRAGAGWR